LKGLFQSTWVHRMNTVYPTQFIEGRMSSLAADRRAGKGIPHVRKQPRSRTKSGAWRRKRSDAGKSRSSKNNGGCAVVLGIGAILLTAFTCVVWTVAV